MSYDVRIIHDVQNLIAEDLTRLHEELGSGSLIARGADAEATAIAYARHVGQIAALKSVLQHIKHVQSDTSPKPKRQAP